jgi:hypothetical protein
MINPIPNDYRLFADVRHLIVASRQRVALEEGKGQ